jgi:hypothetical protein
MELTGDGRQDGAAMRRSEKHDAHDAVEKHPLLRFLFAIDLRREDELFDDQSAKAVADKDDRRVRSAQGAVGDEPFKQCGRGLGDGPARVPACLIGGIANRIDRKAFHVCGEFPRPEKAIVMTPRLFRVAAKPVHEHGVEARRTAAIGYCLDGEIRLPDPIPLLRPHYIRHRHNAILIGERGTSRLILR